jgi:biotin carboxylase
MKIAIIEAMMPELRGPYIYKNGRGEASSIDAAVSRAFKDLRMQLKGKRASIFKCTITVTDKADNEVQFIKETDEDTCIGQGTNPTLDKEEKRQIRIAEELGRTLREMGEEEPKW